MVDFKVDSERPSRYTTIMKYAEEMTEIQRCPPEQATPLAATAYRFAHEDVNDDRNYLPVAKIPATAKRYSRETNDSVKCRMLALSCFSTLEQAKEKWQRIAATSQRFTRNVGFWIGKVDLKDEDGRATQPNYEGHFDFFEHEDCELRGRLELVGEANA